MPTAFISQQLSVCRLRQSFTSLPFVSNVVQQSSNGDIDVTITIQIPVIGTYAVQLLFQDSNGQWDEPSQTSAHAVVVGGNRQTIMPPFRVPARDFKVAIICPPQQASGVIEVWGTKWRIDT